MSFRLVHASGNMFAPADDRHAVITEACAHADIVTLSEVIGDHEFLDTLAGFAHVVAGELAVLWRTDRFTLVDWGHSVVMLGGRRGTGRAGDTRRRGPDRLVLWAVLADKLTGEHVLVATHHAIAKADTTHRWRRPLRRAGYRRTARVVRNVRRRHHGVPAVLTGDLNRIGRIVAFALAGWREVRTPPTFGRLRYDRLYALGGLIVAGVRRFRTAGDHSALWAVVTLNPPTPR